MSKILLVVDSALMLMEYMLQRNLDIEKFNAELKQMKAEGKKTFTIEDLQARQDELKNDIDSL